MAKVMSKEVKAMFVNAETLGDLKNAYMTAMFKYRTKKLLEVANSMYIEKFEAVKDVRRSLKGKVYEKATDETASVFLNAVQYFKTIEDIETLDFKCEGEWIWIYDAEGCEGATKANKEALKNAGCYFSGKRKAWYIAPKNVKRA